MKTAVCPECGFETSDASLPCAFCSRVAEFGPYRRPKWMLGSRDLTRLLILMVLLGILAAFVAARAGKDNPALEGRIETAVTTVFGLAFVFCLVLLARCIKLYSKYKNKSLLVGATGTTLMVLGTFLHQSAPDSGKMSVISYILLATSLACVLYSGASAKREIARLQAAAANKSSETSSV